MKKIFTVTIIILSVIFINAGNVEKLSDREVENLLKHYNPEIYNTNQKNLNRNTQIQTPNQSPQHSQKKSDKSEDYEKENIQNERGGFFYFGPGDSSKGINNPQTGLYRIVFDRYVEADISDFIYITRNAQWIKLWTSSTRALMFMQLQGKVYTYAYFKRPQQNIFEFFFGF